MQLLSSVSSRKKWFFANLVEYTGRMCVCVPRRVLSGGGIAEDFFSTKVGNNHLFHEHTNHAAKATFSDKEFVGKKIFL